MKIKDGFVIREIAGESIVIATGELSKTFHGMIKLNSTGKEIWQMLTDGSDEDAICAAFAEKYDVDKDSVVSDVKRFVDVVRNAGLLEE